MARNRKGLESIVRVISLKTDGQSQRIVQTASGKERRDPAPKPADEKSSCPVPRIEKDLQKGLPSAGLVGSPNETLPPKLLGIDGHNLFLKNPYGCLHSFRNRGSK